MKRTYFITGGSGFIGRAITQRLSEQKNTYIKVFDNNYRGYKKFNIKNKKNIRLIKGDIRNFNEVKKYLNKNDTVIHLAYVNGTKFFYSKPHEVLEIAIKGLMNVVDACKKKSVKKLILASSSEVYNEPKKLPTPETESLKIPDVYNPRFSYSGGKILTELVGINYGRKFFKKLIIFRPHNVYGPNMGYEHVIPELINKVKKSKKNLKIQGSGKEERSFIYIDDFCNAFEKILKKGKHLNVYNIGNSKPTSIKKLAVIIMKNMNINLKLSKSKRTNGSTFYRSPDISKIKALGYKQKISLDNGIKKTISWYL